MIKRSALLALCVSVPCHGLATQDGVPRAGLLPVLTAGDGTQVFVDAASVIRSGDSTFVASTVLRFAPPVARERQVDVEVDTDEIDCGREQVRTMAAATYHESALVQHNDSTTGRFEPVQADWLPIVRATCGVLLGTYLSAPVEHELHAVDVPPELRNRAEIGRALAEETRHALGNTHQPTDASAGVRLRVLETGAVDSSSVRILWSERSDVAAAAARVVLKMRFRPAQVGGRPVPVWISLPVTFHSECSNGRCR